MAPEPDPAASVVDWPDPPDVQPVEAAAVLYSAQLDRFVSKLKDPAPPANDPVSIAGVKISAENLVALVLTGFGLVLVALTVLWPWQWAPLARVVDRIGGRPRAPMS